MLKKVLDVFTGFVAIVWLISGCALDSESSIPIIVCFASLVWLLLYGQFSGYLEGGKK